MAAEKDIEKIKNVPTALVIVGATGDLSRKRIFPALFELFKTNLLPKYFKIIATARTPHSDNDFRQIVKEMLKVKDQNDWQNFAQKITYISADFDQGKNLEEIGQKLNHFEKEAGDCLLRIYYLSVSPAILENAFENLGKNKLHLGCTIHHEKPRIIVEKPFGYNLNSAQKLHKSLLNFFDEDQIYRIDHYLGKETIQNILAFRFANEIFEPIWNKDFIDHVQITTAEDIGVEKRGEFYDKTGALRDITQNHLLQLLTLTTMEEPAKFNAESVNKQKLAVLKSIKIPTRNGILNSTVRGQYPGYLTEEKINPASKTETYALVKLFVQNPRWQDVPFYLRCGKKLTGKVTSIIIQFKERGHKIFEKFWQSPIPNHITIQIQPNEGIGIRLAAKKPGLTTQLEPVDMEFCYRTSFDTAQPDAYERLLLDVIQGDQTLFLSQEIVETSWKIIDPIRNIWDEGSLQLVTYKVGNWGPKEADELIEKDGRTWLAPLLTICKI